MKRLLESGLVSGTHAEIQLDRVGLPLRALLFIQMFEHEKSNLSRFVDEALQVPEVRGAWMISGRFDAVVELATRDTTHLHRVVVETFSSREEVHRIETSVIFEGGRQMDLTAALELTG
ncbi:MAG: Lrp/AsnC ligand binding domain-containing protein [Pseudomonadota bacterium]